MIKQPNRNDVARLAGVAPSTVSHVINGTKFVSEDAKARVLQAVEQLGYQPNLLARSFKLNSTRQISVLVGTQGNFGEIYRGMYEVAYKAGYSLSVIIANDSRADYYADCYARRSEGVINLSRFFCGDKTFEKLKANGMAFVNVRPYAGENGVSINYVNAVEKLAADLAARGRRNVAFLADTSRAEIEPDTRLVAMRYFLSARGLSVEDGMLRCYEQSPLSLDSCKFGYEQAAAVFAARPDTDAVFCVNEYIALGVMKYLKETGRRVPQDVSVCGCDASPLSAYVLPRLSTMGVDMAEFGRKCITSVLSQLSGEKGATSIMYAEYFPKGSV